MIEPNSRVTIADKPLHGNQQNLVDGSVIAINGSVATVLVDHEELPREFSVSNLKVASDVYGAERTSHFDNSVSNQIRRN